MSEDHPSNDTPPRRPPQFSLRALMVAMLLFAVAAAVVGGLLRGGVDRQWAVILGTAAPLGVMMLLSVIDQFLRHSGKKQR